MYYTYLVSFVSIAGEKGQVAGRITMDTNYKIESGEHIKTVEGVVGENTGVTRTIVTHVQILKKHWFKPKERDDIHR